jgi:methionine sulfoxide reductase heme-binding subunit
VPRAVVQAADTPFRLCTLGIVSGWALVFLALSFYVRKYIGVRRWRALHRFTALAWILGVAHSLGEGTDAGQVWFLAMTGVVAVPAVLLLVTRLAPSRRRLA